MISSRLLAIAAGVRVSCWQLAAPIPTVGPDSVCAGFTPARSHQHGGGNLRSDDDPSRFIIEPSARILVHGHFCAAARHAACGIVGTAPSAPGFPDVLRCLAGCSWRFPFGLGEKNALSLSAVHVDWTSVCCGCGGCSGGVSSTWLGHCDFIKAFHTSKKTLNTSTLNHTTKK